MDGADEMETVDPGLLVQHWKSARIAAHTLQYLAISLTCSTAETGFGRLSGWYAHHVAGCQASSVVAAELTRVLKLEQRSSMRFVESF